MADNKLLVRIAADASEFVRGVSQAEKSITGFQGELKSFESVARGALSFAGIGLGTAEIIQLADAYGQMTGKLKLVTQYSGDYAEVQKMLRDSASATRADLPATVNLYTQLSPALKGIGLSAKESVGLITTINQAIVLSGASSEAAQAALVQLGQGFASGALRGEELNSIMEQTPALAQAIADGLGVSRGALRDMGAEGKLTAEAVAQALQKVADQISEDFSKMPVTVGQAFTKLRNEILVYVGATDQAYGGTSALAEVIGNVADEFKNGGPAVTAFSGAIKIMVDGLDGAYRMLKIVGLGLAGYAAAAKAALAGNFSEAKTIWQELGRDIDAVLLKPLVGQNKAVEATANTARERLKLEKQLADETVKLEGLKLYTATGTLDKVVGKEKAAVDARIADQQRLVDAVRTAWQQQLAEAEKFAESAKAKLAKATDFRESGQASAFNIGLKGLSEEDQLAAKSSRMTDLQGQGSYESAKARMAAIEGDLKKFDAASDKAEKRLKEALKLAEDIGDIASVESISNDLAKNQEAGAALDQKKSEEAKARAADQAKLLNGLQAQLDALDKKARELEVQIDATKAESAIKGLKAQLDEIKDKTVTVTVNTAGSTEVLTAAKTTSSSDSAPAYASGGWTGPGGKYKVAGVVHAGEFVHRQEVVRQPGAMAFLARFNQIGMNALKGYANGGLVANMAIPSTSSASSAAAGKNLTLVLGDNRFGVNAGNDVIAQIESYIGKEALRKGFRR